MPGKQSNAAAHLAVNGKDYGWWAVAEGGGVSIEETTYQDHDGEVQLGGVATREAVTLRKLYRDNTVHEAYFELDAVCVAGGGSVVQTLQPTGDDGIAWGRPIVRTGKVGAVNPPNLDKSSSEAAELEIVLHLNARLA